MNSHTTATKPPRTFYVYWAPEGRRIATVKARDEREARRKAPLPWRKYLGEIYAVSAELMEVQP